MKRLLITAALVSSFLILCFGWLLASGPEDGHTWDERSNGIVQDQPVKGPVPTGIAVIPLGKSYILIWREHTVPAKWQGPKLGGFSYFILRGR